MRSLRFALFFAAIIVVAADLEAARSSGMWMATRENDRLLIRLVGHDKKFGTSDFTIAISDLSGLDTSQIDAPQRKDVSFVLRRDPGTINFHGRFASGEGSGDYTFTGSDTFLRNLAGLGYKNFSDDMLLLYATTGLNSQWIRDLRSMGYTPTKSQLEQISIFKITPAYIGEIEASGYKNLPIQQFVDLRVGKIDATRIREYRELGFTTLSPSKLSEFGIMKVTPDFIRALASAGYRNVSPDKLVEMRIFKVTPEYIASLREAGYENVPIDRLIQLRQSGADKIFLNKKRD